MKKFSSCKERYVLDVWTGNWADSGKNMLFMTYNGVSFFCKSLIISGLK